MSLLKVSQLIAPRVTKT